MENTTIRWTTYRVHVVHSFYRSFPHFGIGILANVEEIATLTVGA